AFDSGPIANHYNASINWGDSFTSAGTITFSGSTFTVSGTHTYGEEGSYTISVTVNHETSVPVGINGTATVTDPSVVAGPGITITAVEGGAAFNGTLATFTDPGGAEPNASDPNPNTI